ncbi:Tcp11-domain-containing protein [Venturia nashicola]|uniref:Tcp11-domain-containing protein n=1 Tax=Venturia nashicola TaxID=86259 RepID=A0A4Z1P4A5_9PEZI|nr:Tcp11-domain-containing protein [Venturia nashicola]TLD22518.1 Tcp11-domain-containing protein [Venturia nashicola]
MTEQSADNTTPRSQRGVEVNRGIRSTQAGLDIIQDTSVESCPRNDRKNMQILDTTGRYPSRDPLSHNEAPPHKDGTVEPMIAQAFQDLHGKDTLECAEAIHYFTCATKEPPITKKSLAELDTSCIIINSKLRHDVNFDRELHFRPNMDGPKGRAKREAYNGYWFAITAELDLYGWMLQTSASAEMIRLCQKRVPTMFDTISEILKSVVPEWDQPAVDQHLDKLMVMQEIEKGVCDFVNIAEWLAKLLKEHCAPMRDDMVDKVVGKIRRGTSEWISEGLGDLFGVLEAMKLVQFIFVFPVECDEANNEQDVANHQIRHLRALLIEDTINFEQTYHVSRMLRKRYDIKYARSWYLEGKKNLQRIPLTASWPNRDVEGFVSALYQSLLPDSTIALPDTFLLDSDRLRLLRVDLDALIRERICCDLLDQMVRKKGKFCSAIAKSTFKKDLQVIICEGRNPIKWDIHSISVELTRHTLRECGTTAKIDAALTRFADHNLSEAFSTPSIRATFATSHKCALSKELFTLVKSLLRSSLWDIFNNLVPPTLPSGTIPLPPPSFKKDRQNDVLQRITHIAVLHWRTWENIVYNNDDPHLDSLCPSSTPSRTPSPSHIVDLKVPVLPPRSESPVTETGTAETEIDSNGESMGLKSG